MRLAEHCYRTITSIRSQLLLLERVQAVRLGEIVRVESPDGSSQEGEVLLIEGDTVLVQVFGDCQGLDLRQSTVVFADHVKQAPLTPRLLNRVFNGSFAPLDELPPPLPEKWARITGHPMNPTSRARPEEFIETGFSAIDGLNTLVKGQKLPIFSCAGLPAKEIAAAILKNCTLAGGGDKQAVVFAALGLTHYEFSYYMKTLAGLETNFVAFINLASDPVVERLLAPRFALTVAEYLAFELELDVLVLITDMTNYCDALRELSTAREELPGRRGYPGYLYSDLASIFERAGRLKDRPGSVTMLPIVTMPEDDITHPIPDLTGYITEGQIVLQRDLHRQGIFPPVDVLPSLSRLMQQGIGANHTRADHRPLANLLYRYYAKGRDLRGLEAIVGRDGLSPGDLKILEFADSFEKEFIHQGDQRRHIGMTLDLGLDLLKKFELETP
jgi:V/A-type H+-transporting ATPase subunit B